MAAFLSPEYLAAARQTLADLDAVDAVDTAIQYVISGAPGGKIHVAVTVEGGRVVDVEAGRLDDPPITCTLAYDEARSIVAGDTTADSSFMRGAIKVEGAHAVWLLDLRALRDVVLPALAALLD